MLKLIAFVLTTLATLSSAQATVSIDALHVSNQTPYGNPAATSIKAPPPGYKTFFLETVARHGSRTMTGTSTENRVMTVWNGAAKRNALTDVGKRFDNDVRAFQAAERTVGYGQLTTQGKDQWAGIGRRTAVNYADFFAKVQADGDRIQNVTTPVLRTKQSAVAMRSSLRAAYPGLTYQPTVTDLNMVIGNGASRQGNAAIAKALRTSNVRTAARHVLRRIYTAKYVDSLSDPVGKALDIYLLYCTAAGVRAETPVTFARYVPLDDARVLGYAKDAQNFYRYGPGVSGQTSSYRAARPVLADFFARLDKRIAGGSTAAVFRFAHGETTMPFEALIRVPGSQKQVSASTYFHYGDNPWRGYVAGLPAGNVEWAVYRNASGGVLVTMRYNERPVKFRSSCTPSALNPYFYRVSALKRCLS
jgi:hypothetical protein